MGNSWRRSGKSDWIGDLQALVLLMVLAAVVGYLLFPDFFGSIYGKLTGYEAEETFRSGDLSEFDLNIQLPEDDLYTSPSVYEALYQGDSAISTGYWVIFVGQMDFEQLPLSADSYSFLLQMIDEDRNATLTKNIILAANGTVVRYEVSEDIYSIIQSMGRIKNRI